MTQAKSIDDIEVPLFADIHIQYIEKLVEVYRQDKANIDSLEYSAKPEYSMLQIHMSSLDSQISVLNYVLEVMRVSKDREELERTNTGSSSDKGVLSSLSSSLMHSNPSF